jgi:predicted transport protein
LPKDYSIRVTENFKLFEQLLNERKDDLVTVCKGLAKLVVVDIALTRDRDNPQLIFESMNSTGRELSQADLIRNYILMGLEPKLQTKLYEQYWRPMEIEFGQEAYVTNFDGFMRYFLTVKTGTLPNVGEVYNTFKQHAQSPQVAEAGVESLVADIRNYARYFCAMTLGAEPNAALKIAFQDLRELKVDVAYPFLMELYRDYDLKLLSQADFLTAVRLVESYVFRRVICAIPTNSMNKTFATFGKALDKDAYLESIQAHLLLLPSYRRFPSDEEFKRAFQIKDLYKFRSRSYWLRRLENHQRKERVSIDEYTIEHILPQNENLSLAWKEALGEDWQRIHQTYLHTLGNLTLTGYNSEYSDKAFTAKRDMKGGFKESPLKLNQGLGAIEQWDETAIRHRADLLSTMALAVWIAPKITHETLESYKSKPVKAGYSIADYPQLTAGTVRDLFEAFRKEILALDSCVTEEFLKLYIAYKAETNFVDIVPQAKRLRISLNMPFSEINDPRGICKDVSAVGRWGNGDVEIGLADLAELPYVMGLVRQALERQMGSL